MALFARQKVLLDLIDRAGGAIDRMRLVKLAFLVRYEEIPEDASFYGFVPYHYGPFSFQLYHDLEKMIDKGWLDKDDTTYRRLLPDTDPPPMPAKYRDAVDRVWRAYGQMEQQPLVKRVYAHHPWYTANSKIADTQAPIPYADIAVYTAGYEGLGLDDFLNHLLKHGIKQLIDVRKNPVARRYGFHRSTMYNACTKMGITYRHMPDLGIPGELRSELNCQSDYDRLFERYCDEILPQHDAAIRQVERWVSQLPTVLVCMEADPRQCHRTHLGREISRRTGLDMIDLGIQEALHATA